MTGADAIEFHAYLINARNNFNKLNDKIISISNNLEVEKNNDLGFDHQNTINKLKMEEKELLNEQELIKKSVISRSLMFTFGDGYFI